MVKVMAVISKKSHVRILSKPQFTIWVIECGMILNCGLDSMHGVCVCMHVRTYACMLCTDRIC